MPLMTEHDQLNAVLAQLLREKGWQPVWCTLNHDGEWTPLVGTTGGAAPFGAEGAQPSGAKLAFRPPPGVKILDIDNDYGEKHGRLTIDAAEERLGTLPQTWVVTARDPATYSGRYLYRCPEDVEFNDAVLKPFGYVSPQTLKLATDVEVVRTRHRFSWAPGTVHHKNNELIRVYGPDGDLSAMPSVGELPMLPGAWIDYLRDPPRTQSDVTFRPDPLLPSGTEWWQLVPDASLSSRGELGDFAYWMLIGTGNDQGRVVEELSRVSLAANPDDPWLDKDFYQLTDANTQGKTAEYIRRAQENELLERMSKGGTSPHPQVQAVQETSQVQAVPETPPSQEVVTHQEAQPEPPAFDITQTDVYKQEHAREWARRAARENLDREIREQKSSTWSGFRNPMKAPDPPPPCTFHVEGSPLPGSHLITPQTVTVLYGNRSSGKTWAAATWAAQELRAGNHVIWLDFERQETLMKRKLSYLGAAAQTAAEKQFHYTDELPPLDLLVAGVGLFREMSTHLLLVIDSFRDLLNAVVPDGSSNDGEAIGKVYGEYLDALVKAGATICLIDHAPKAAASSAFGSERKESAADYVLRVEQKVVFTQSIPGYSTITVTKDRYGVLPSGDAAGHLWVPAQDTEAAPGLKGWPSIPEFRNWEPAGAALADLEPQSPAERKDWAVRRLLSSQAPCYFELAEAVTALLAQDMEREDKIWISAKGPTKGNPVSKDGVAKSVLRTPGVEKDSNNRLSMVAAVPGNIDPAVLQHEYEDGDGVE